MTPTTTGWGCRTPRYRVKSHTYILLLLGGAAGRGLKHIYIYSLILYHYRRQAWMTPTTTGWGCRTLR